MTTNKKHYSNNGLPTREASESWYDNLTVGERMEVDILAGQLVTGIKSVGMVQFSKAIALELIFVLPIWLHGGGEIHRRRHVGDMGMAALLEWQRQQDKEEAATGANT